MNRVQRFVAKVLGVSESISGMPDWPERYIDRPYHLPKVALDFPNAYRKVAIVRACVDRIADDCAMLPIVFERYVRGEWQAIPREGGNIVDVWHSANRAQAGIEMVRDLHAYYEIMGNTYLVMDTMQTSRIQELWTLAPHLVEPVPGKDRTERGYVFNRGGRRVFIAAEDVVHMRAFNPDDEPLGSSALESVQHSYENRYDAGRVWQNVLRSGGTAAGYFRLAGSDKRQMEALKGPERAAAERALTKMYGSIDATRKARILDVWEFVQTGMSMSELNTLEQNAASDADVCRAKGVPPWMVGIKEGGKLSDGGSQSDERIYWQQKIMTVTEFRDRIFTEKFCPRFGPGIRMRTDFSRVIALRQPIFNAAQQLAALSGRAPFTVNELRRMLGEQPSIEPGADVLYERPASALDALAQGGGNAPAANSDGKPAKGAAARSARLIDGDAVREERRKNAVGGLRKYERKLSREYAAVLSDWRARIVAQLEAQGSRGRHIRMVDPDEAFTLSQADRDRLISILSNMVAERGEEALAELPVNVEIALGTARARDFILANSQRTLSLIEETTRQALRESIAASVDSGETMSQLIARISEAPEFGLARAQTIARTEVVSAYNFATNEAWRQSGVVEQVEWLSSGDAATRETHLIADGQRADMGGSFDVGGESLAFPGDPSGSPGEVINCYLPGTEVRGSFVAGVRSEYVGPAVEVVTRAGKRLRVTPNHPVLTDKGMVPAGSLRQGDNLVADVGVGEALAPVAQADQQDEPSLIEDVFESLRVRIPSSRHHLAPNDLHGDARCVVGDVDVVRPDGGLLLNVQPATAKNLGDGIFVGESLEQAGRDGGGSGALGLEGVSASASSSPSGAHLTADSLGVALEDAPLLALGIGAPADLNSALRELAHEGGASDSKLIGETLERHAGTVSLDDVIEVRHFDFAGHVYDLQSECGLMVAQGIVSSNCRCTLLPVVSAEAPRSGTDRPWFKRGAAPSNRVAALLNGHSNGKAAHR